MSNNKASKTFVGTIWSVVQKFGTMLVNFVSSMVLARLLSPSDYGCIGMLMIFITISQAFVDGGFASALIQKHKPSQEDLSTVFLWNVFLAIVLYIILFISAPYIASFYNNSLLRDVLRVMGLSLIINSFCIVHVTVLQIELKFKQLAIRDLVASVLSVLLTIVLAFHGWGVWALVAQILSVGLIKTLILWFSKIWKPSFVFSSVSFKSLFKFGGFMFLTNILNAIGNNIQGLLLGRYATPVVMGYYSQAKKLSDVPSTGLTGVVEQVAFPVMSGYNSKDPQNASDVLKRYLCAVAYVVTPVMLLLVLVSKPVITIVYSSKWLPCVPYFNILCVAAIFVSLQAILQSSLAAHGDSKDLFHIAILKRAIEICIMFIGLYVWEIYGLLFGMLLSSVISFSINAFLAQKKIGYEMINLLKDITPIMIISVLAFAPSYIIIFLRIGKLSLTYVWAIITFLLIYLCGSFLFKIPSFYELRGVLFRLFKRNEN